jgi:hypothetical protein
MEERRSTARSCSPRFPLSGKGEGPGGYGRRIGVTARDPRPLEGGSKTVYLVTPVTYDGKRADEQEVAQAFDSLVKDATAAGALKDAGVESVGFSVVQPTGDEIPLGIEPVPDDA